MKDNHVRDLTPAEIAIFNGMLAKLQSKNATKDIKRLRCAIYARKSQEDEKAISLFAQVNHCRKLISKCELLEEVAVFQEDNVSGMWIEKRVEFQKMLEQVEKRELDVIVCFHSDRLSRDISDSLNSRKKITSCDAYILEGNDSMVVNDSTSMFIKTVFLATNDLYARQGAEKTMNALLTLAEQGNYVGGKAPFGYKNSATKSLEIDRDEAVVVTLIYNKVLSRYEFCCHC